MVIRYEAYIEHIFLKLFSFGFGCNARWIFSHINFAYFSKVESCVTFTDIHCCREGLFCSVDFDVKRFLHML